MIFSTSLYASLATIAAGLSPAAPEASRPISLVAQAIGNEVVIRVIGSSRTPIQASYELETAGGPAGSSNRSVQRGSARITPDRDLTLITLKIGNVSGGDWHAKLRVQVADGSEYEEVAGSALAPPRV